MKFNATYSPFSIQEDYTKDAFQLCKRCKVAVIDVILFIMAMIVLAAFVIFIRFILKKHARENKALMRKLKNGAKVRARWEIEQRLCSYY